MAVNPITFDDEHVRARDHGALFNGILNDGKLSGCQVSYNGTNATIGKGYLVACGREIEFDSNTSVAVSGVGFAQIILNIDLSNMPPYLSAVKSSTQSFPALTQNDINDGISTVYQMELAVINLANNTVISQIPQATPKIGTVGADKIADGAITTAKIADGAVTSAKLGSDIPYTKVGLSADQVLHIVISATQPSGDWDVWLKPEA